MPACVLVAEQRSAGEHFSPRLGCGTASTSGIQTPSIYVHVSKTIENLRLCVILCYMPVAQHIRCSRFSVLTWDILRVEGFVVGRAISKVEARNKRWVERSSCFHPKGKMEVTLESACINLTFHSRFCHPFLGVSHFSGGCHFLHSLFGLTSRNMIKQRHTGVEYAFLQRRTVAKGNFTHNPSTLSWSASFYLH